MINHEKNVAVHFYTWFQYLVKYTPYFRAIICWIDRPKSRIKIWIHWEKEKTRWLKHCNEMVFLFRRTAYIYIYRMIKTWDNKNYTWRSCTYIMRVEIFKVWGWGFKSTHFSHHSAEIIPCYLKLAIHIYSADLMVCAFLLLLLIL